MASDKVFVTDLNARERARFVLLARAEAEGLGKLADVLEAGNDVDLLGCILTMALSGGWHKDLVEALKSLRSVEVPDSAEGAEGGS